MGAHSVLLIDLGGGSREVTLSRDAQLRDTVSLPLGAVRLDGVTYRMIRLVKVS